MKRVWYESLLVAQPRGSFYMKSLLSSKCFFGFFVNSSIYHALFLMWFQVTSPTEQMALKRKLKVTLRSKCSFE